MKKIKICGVGSVLLGDDAVGPYTARWIAANYEFGEGVEVEDLGTPGLDLIAYMTGIDVLILIDSVENREPAGTVTVYDKAAITRQRPAVRLDPHSPCITESIFVAELAGDGPEDVYLIGVTGEQLEVGAPLSDSVRNAIPLTVQNVLERVVLHGGSWKKRETAIESDIWWEAAQMRVSA
ncbi:MAG TPA: hydrogenase maturation protease [Candidatus Saccharimonadales bacterium]|nr:hydrogenase maturation protease [Candidatus Saccharimonadales bacterium]